MGVSPELGNQTQLRAGVPSINLSCMRLANFRCFLSIIIIRPGLDSRPGPVWSKYSNAQRVSSLHFPKSRLNPPCA